MPVFVSCEPVYIHTKWYPKILESFKKPEHTHVISREMDVKGSSNLILCFKDGENKTDLQKLGWKQPWFIDSLLLSW